ncbi:Alpha/beta hydrolase family-domain-containing protein [Lasiosphaeria miniovina]|uniref:Alpha/beta hydrolase family-domain-containing protein n=1 Tax=Lasiosphaeria miniovina TaxID=1954250 RepID=A0AA40DNJ0_9PEZI|nr:Alpha/beta hydrolase family-domain-containing protein [Lasiosphaeria miniovina]KAK0709745.1 Alpha/beta hydrolase family-domain-containing protein [Lasiosphaeria miniovina]
MAAASPSAFDVREHVVEAQHIREYPHGTAHSQEDVLHLAVKQYIPRSNPDPQPGDVTIIASHANGFVKELYEPLWEDLVRALGQRGVRVRGIWIADVAWQGQSGIINDEHLGNDPSWTDHARDLLLMVNKFRSAMVRPLIGVGHSFGANIIVNLALLHPRLLSSLVLLDPVLSHFARAGPAYGYMPMKQSAYRRDRWPSRAEAAAGFRRNAFYSTWDPRALEALIEHGLRDDGGDDGRVTLTTSKHMECFTYYRPKAQGYDAATGQRVIDTAKKPVDATSDFASNGNADFVFYRPESPLTTERLPSLRPGVLWVFGEHSGVNPPDVRQEKMDLTGVGVGGSGGVAAGRVRQVMLEGYGHLVPMEATTRCAEHAAEFVAADLAFWRDEQREFQEWAKKPKAAKQMLDDDWMRWLGPLERKKPQQPKL